VPDAREPASEHSFDPGAPESPPPVAEPPPTVAEPPKTRTPPKLPRLARELAGPTAKVALALVAVAAAAAGLGMFLGLPLPGAGADAQSSPLDPGPLDQGTAAIPPDGPFFPVLGPVDYGAFDARFGGGRGHPGQDMLTKRGTALIAVRGGTIIDGGTLNGRYSGGRGNYLYLWSPQDKRTYVYEHMASPSPLHIGDKVVAGQYVGRVGCTGSCDGPHLHFEIRLGYDDLRHDPKPIDPLPLLKQWAHAPPDALVGSPDN
jgi:murein DD-endopeptidase MepM/ murein hydrolase activator NlpD